MEKAEDYSRRGDECRKMARKIANQEQRAILEGMAVTWDHLADQRRRLILPFDGLTSTPNDEKPSAA